MNPQLRRLDIQRLSTDDGDVLVFHDAAGYAPDLALDAALAPLLVLMDGTRTPAQIADTARRNDPDFPQSWLDELIAEMDEHLLLQSPHFGRQRAAREAHWNAAPQRKAAFAGRSYSDESGVLNAFLDAKLQTGNARLPARAYDAQSVRAIVTPHIDFHRGGHTEAASYAPLIENVRATKKPFDTLVILGIAHAGVQYPFCAAAKDYDTPLGTMKCDREFLGDLESRIGPQLLSEQFAHKDEHSIEFAAVLCQFFPELKSSQIVPILCGGFWKSLQSGQPPERADTGVAEFIEVLREVTREHEARGKKIGFIASVDGAHVGTQFGDNTPLSPLKLREIEREDRKWCAAIEAGDRAALHAHFAKNGNRFNVDAHPALYALLAAFPSLRGQTLDYDQAYHPDQNIVVSFASLALFEV